MGQRRSPLDVVELERLAARGWRGTEAAPLGDWLLRAGGAGFSKRAHSALVVGDPGVPVAAAVGLVTDWYAARGLRPCAQLPGRQARPADAAFAAAGWERDEDTVVMTTELNPGLGAQLPGSGPVVAVSPAPDDDWTAACRQHGTPLPAGALTVLTGAERTAFASVRDGGGGESGGGGGGEVVAVARGVLTDDWLGVTAVTVAEHARRRGLGSAVVQGLQRWAVEHGARWCYLQVVAGNAPARALWTRLGFIEHHRYHYRWAPAD